MCYDQFNDLITTVNGRVNISFNSTTAVLSTPNVTFSNGIGTFSFSDSVPQVVSIRMIDSFMIGGTFPAAITALVTGPAVKYVSSYSSLTSSVDSLINITVGVYDSNNTLCTWWNNVLSLNFGNSSSSAYLIGGNPVTFANGIAIFSIGNTIPSVNTVYFNDTYGLQTPNPTNVTWTLGAPAKYYILSPLVTNNGSFVKGNAKIITAQVQDQFGNLVNTYNGTANMTATGTNIQWMIGPIMNFVNGIASVSINSSSAQTIILQVASLTSFDKSFTQQLTYSFGYCTKLLLPAVTTPVNMITPPTITIECVNSSSIVDVTVSNVQAAVVINTPYASFDNGGICTLMQGVCTLVLYPYIFGGPFTITSKTTTSTPGLTNTSISITWTQTTPVIWTSGPTGALTPGGVKYYFNGNYFLAAGACPTGEPNVTFVSTVTGYTGVCNITFHNNTRIECIVPAGQGAPEVVLYVCGIRQIHLPRWQYDTFFWVWSPHPTTANCVATFNPW